MKKLIFALIILFFTISAYAATYKITFTWDANTEPDLAGYKLYRSEQSIEQSGVYDPDIYHIIAYDATTDIIENLSFVNTQYFVITAFDQAGYESDYSNEVAFTPDPNIINLPPSIPGGFQGSIQIINNYY